MSMKKLWVIKGKDGTVLNTFAGDVKERYIGTNWEGQIVYSVEQLAEPVTPVEVERRMEREEKFADTVDKMNPMWYQGLTTEEQSDLNNWRLDWLEYPSTGIIPDDTLIQGIFESDLE
tara:strand:+ start:1313 stop:1666 length:354 start_codon:yes stop_codon:yes gene_type:complete